MTRWLFLIVSATLLLASTGAQEVPRTPQWLAETETALTEIDDYTAIFRKRERIGDKLWDEETIFLKFKRPFKIYLKWIKPPYQGREVLFVEGWNNNRLRAHEGGILSVVTLDLDPLGTMAMKGNRHPIHDAGIGKLMKLVATDLRKGLKKREIQIREHGETVVGERKTRKIELIYPRDQYQGYYAYRAALNLDLENKLPILIDIFDWNDELVESYRYDQIKLNPGLSDVDFDPRNPEYHF